MNNIVKVHNKNDYPFQQQFKGKIVQIPAHKHIDMDYDEAVHFLGAYYAPVMTKGGVQDPKSYKYLEIDKDDEQRILAEKDGESSGSKEKWACHMCGKDFRTKNGLMKHIKTKHVNDMVDEEARDELLDDEDITVDEEES